jgi:Holliday junction DNA helicase RuvB
MGPEENHFNYALRPQSFSQYVGQPTLIRRLKIAVDAAKGRSEPSSTCLLHGPPGSARRRWRT